MDVSIKVITTQINEIGEKNIIRLNTEGTLYQKKNCKYVIYKEVENGEEITTSLKIEEDIVTIKRFGGINSTLVFKEGYKEASRYLTSQGTFIIENCTNELKIDDGENIFIDIDYNIEIMGMFTGRNLINIEITQK